MHTHSAVTLPRTVPELPKIARVKQRIPKVRDVKAVPQTIPLEREEHVVADVQEFTGPHLPDQRDDSDRTDAVALQPEQGARRTPS